MLELKKIYWNAAEGANVLDGVDLTIPDRKLVVITGPNGGGKTTLARIIAGIEKPSSGSVVFDGEDITSLDVTQRARRGISFAFQQPVRFKGITVRRLIGIAAGSTLDDAELCDILSSVGLCAKEYMDREVNSTLSGGEIKRIEIATVLARHSKLSVFDEPEAGIDLWSFTNLIDIFKKMRGEIQGTLVIISHQERILRIADEIVLLADGRIRDSGPADLILERMLGQGEAKFACSKQEEMFNE